MSLYKKFETAITEKRVGSQSMAMCWESFFAHIKAEGKRPAFDLGTLNRAEQLVSERMQGPTNTAKGTQRTLDIEKELATIARSFNNPEIEQAGQYWLDEIRAKG